jgi:arginine decarboxylase
MAFLDIAREIMQNSGEKLLDSLLDSIGECSAKMEASGVRLLGSNDIPGFSYDSTRITANMSEIGLSGYNAEKILRERMNIQVEMSDLTNIVCIATVADTAESIRRLFEGIRELAACTETGKKTELPVFPGLQLLERVLTPADILQAKTRKVPLRDAAGRISGEIISPYPPGVALVCPGEVITAAMVEFLVKTRQCGGNVQGIDENENIVVI